MAGRTGVSFELGTARARRPLGRGAPFVGHELRTPLRTIHHLASLPSHAPAAAAESGFVSPGVRLVGVRCRMFVPKKIARGVLTAVKYHNILAACQEIPADIAAPNVARGWCRVRRQAKANTLDPRRNA